jgi:hypothetical protein
VNDSGDQVTWDKAYAVIDYGAWAGEASACGATSDLMPILWGGPAATLRWDGQGDADVKWLSVRELEPPGTVWRGDAETGDLSQWSKVQMVSADRLQVVSAPLRQGRYAYRYEVRQGDNPINASGNRAEAVYSPPEREGSERYYGWSTLWPHDYPSYDTWQLFTQWHHLGSSGSPPVELFVRGESIFLRVSGLDVWRAPLERGRWVDFTLRVKWSQDPAIGFVELWVDGKLALARTHRRTMLDEGSILKQGLYRNSTIDATGVIYHDGMRIGHRLADVQ